MARGMGPNKTKTTATTAAKGEVPSYVCPHCGVSKKQTDFYVSSDPAVRIGIAFPCKSCAEKIARRYNEKTGKYSDATVDSLKEALRYLDKPFLWVLYDGAFREMHDTSLTNRKTSIWSAYIVMVQMKQYKTLRWKDGDFDNNDSNVRASDGTYENRDVSPEVFDELEKNRKDVIRLIGYDPFEKESEEDKPLLYAQLVGYIDSDGNNDDMTRILDSIEIVRGYLQLQKLNDMSAVAFSNLAKNGQSGEIKNYMDTKKKVADVISQLAEQSCISLKHNKNAKKGENTWTGKIKKLKELNLREADNNGFDINTCRGMQQVLEMSDASIMKQLQLDESEWADMIADQRKMLVNTQHERDVYKEINRVLLKENLDLRDTLEDNGLLSVGDLTNLKDLFSTFSETESMQSEDDYDDDEEEQSE